MILDDIQIRSPWTSDVSLQTQQTACKSMNELNFSGFLSFVPKTCFLFSLPSSPGQLSLKTQFKCQFLLKGSFDAPIWVRYWFPRFHNTIWTDISIHCCFFSLSPSSTRLHVFQTVFHQSHYLNMTQSNEKACSKGLSNESSLRKSFCLLLSLPNEGTEGALVPCPS